MRRRDPLALAPAVATGLLVLPVAAGIAGVLLPAFGINPALGGSGPSLDAWRALMAAPGLGRSVLLSLWTGLAATALSLAATIAIAAALHGTRAFALARRLLAPLLAAPHAAAAFGLAFLIAPSGWIVRALSPWATGWERPPDLLILGDPWGLSLIAGLAAKEVPFLFLMLLAALPQSGAERALTAAASLGYRPAVAWLKIALPRLYPQMRLPVWAVLAFSVSVVDVAMILGPTTPAPLAVRLTLWMRSPDLGLWAQASAGAALMLGLVALALGLWRLGEIAAARAGRRWIEAGGRGAGLDPALRGIGAAAAVLAVVPLALGFAGLAVWSVAGPWPFPDLMPAAFSGAAWAGALPALGGPALASLGIGLASAGMALLVALAWLEAETRRGRPAGRGALAILYLPLLAPQVAFLFGLQTLATAAGLDGGAAAVAAAHLVFVLPYVHLALADPWRALDPRYGTAAASLGAGPWRVFAAVRLPLLLAPVLTAAAVGFAVSIGLYLPTLLIGGGRVATLTTEAVALASGGDRRLIGVYAALQTLAPALGFALALGLPALLWRDRRGLGGRR